MGRHARPTTKLKHTSIRIHPEQDAALHALGSKQRRRVASYMRRALDGALKRAKAA